MSLRDLARRAANGVMNSDAPGARATAVAQIAARVGHDMHPALGIAAGAAGAAVVAAEQLLGRYESGQYATFRTDERRAQ